MADKIALMEEEYTSLLSQLESAHDQILEHIEAVVGKLEATSAQGGDFYTDEISPKVSQLCEELNNVKAAMEEIYSAHREIIRSFGSSVADLDISC